MPPGWTPCFEAAGRRVIGGTLLFRLAEHPQATILADHLGEAGILVSSLLPAQPTWLRFGIPGPQRPIGTVCTHALI